MTISLARRPKDRSLPAEGRLPGKPRILYVAYCEGFAKIGLTATLRTRIGSMQSGCPFPIECLGGWTVPNVNAMRAEHAAHILLDDSHHFGEWFRCTRTAACEAARVAAEAVGGATYRTPDPKPPTVKFRPPAKRHIDPAPKEPKAPYIAAGCAVITPKGNFVSLAAAGRAHGISRQAAWDRAKKGTQKWMLAL